MMHAHTSAATKAHPIRLHAVEAIGRRRARSTTSDGSPSGRDGLRRILAKYAGHYNEGRTRVPLGKDAPCTRLVERFGDIVAHPILAARAVGQQIDVLRAANEREIDQAFRTMAQQRSDALLVAHDPFFNSRREQLVTLKSPDPA